MAETKKELFDESLEILEEKKGCSKTLNQIKNQAAKTQGIEAAVLKRVKDYECFRGRGWDGASCWKEAGAEYPDKITVAVSRLLEIVSDLGQVGKLDILDDYLRDLGEEGIKIEIDRSKFPTIAGDVGETWDAILSMVEMQNAINSHRDTLTKEKAVEAEELNISPKKDFAKLLDLYHQKMNDKDIDDKYQSWILSLEQVETAVNEIYDGAYSE